MKTLKEMNMGELKELYLDHLETYTMSGCEMYKEHALEVERELMSRVNQPVVTINVSYEQGYKWSVDVDGGESVATYINKAEALTIAKELNKNQFNGKAIIKAQKLSKQERKDNMSWLHEGTSTYR